VPLAKTRSHRLLGDRSHRTGLVLACSFSQQGGPAIDSVSRRDGALIGGVFGWGSRGPVRSHIATTDRVNFGSASFLPTGPCTVIVAARKRDGTNRTSALFGLNFDADTKGCGAHCPYVDGIVYWDYGGQSAGTTRLSVAGLTFGDDVWCFSTGPRGMEIWQNAVRRASNGGNPTRVATAAINFKLGEHGGILSSDLVDYGCLLIYDRQLDTSLIRELSIDPFLPWEEPDDLRKWAPAVAAGAVLPLVIDDGDPGYSETAGWGTASDFPVAYGDTYRFPTAGAGDGSHVATWQVAGQPSGTYSVHVSWPEAVSNRATNAPYRIYDGATLLATVRINQTEAAGGPSFGGTAFRLLGNFPFTSGTLKVTLADDADDYVVADAVRFAPAFRPDWRRPATVLGSGAY
jgi:hypothetical protein